MILQLKKLKVNDFAIEKVKRIAYEDWYFTLY